jgi:myo-inositol-1-phosphate synthase
MSERPLGVMLVGLGGATASTTVIGATSMRLGLIPEQYGTTAVPPLKNLRLARVADMVFSGWDYVSNDLWEAGSRHRIIQPEILASGVLKQHLSQIKPLKGLRTPLDIPKEGTHNNVEEVQSIRNSVNDVRDSVERFKRVNQLGCIVTVFLGSPHLHSKAQLKTLCRRDLVSVLDTFPPCAVQSGLIYALGSILAGAHFVDFTASETLECPLLGELAEECGVQFAGRDGSTGETMLKLVVAEMFRIRNLRVHGWFGTNILGNHDGYVLGLPGYDQTKMHDKKHGLGSLLGYDDFEHIVAINYFGPRGDRKESWDVVDFSGWMGTRMSLRLNWHGEDSMLAAPLILDLVRLIEYGSRYHLKGLQSQLGVFFKYPLPTGRSTGIADQFRQLAGFYENLGK